MKKYNLLKKVTAVATTATMLLSTAPLTVFAETQEDTSYSYYLYDNTITDKMTGITVKGNLPYECKMHVYVNFLQSTTFTDLNDSNSGISTLDDIETGFPKRGGKPVTAMSNPINWEESTKEISNETLIPQINIAFSSESKVLDFDSSLLVTVPYDFYKYYGATPENNQVAVFTNGYTEDDTKGLTVVNQDRVGKNAFTFKADAPGSFYIGKPSSLQDFATSLAVNAEEIAIPQNNNQTKVIDVDGYIYKGITIETANPNHISGNVTVPKQFTPDIYGYDVDDEKYYDFVKYKEDYIKEMFFITMNEADPAVEYEIKQGYHNSLNDEEMEEIMGRTIETTLLNENVKINIPCNTKDLYVVNVNDPYIPYEIDAEYIDGKYVFETDHLGYFVLSSQPLPEYKVPELKQQTITDKFTGITVTGLLPVDAKIEFDILSYPEVLFTDFMDSDFTAYSFYHPRYALPEADRLYTTMDVKEDPLPEHFDWSYIELGDSVNVQILFRDGLRIVDFSSDLTVTLPNDFNRLLTQKLNAYKINYNKNTLCPVEILSDKKEDNFSFKANSEGAYIIGVDSNIEYILNDAYANIEETATEETATEKTTDVVETVGTVSNVNTFNPIIIIAIAGGVLLIAVFAIVIVLVKRKK